MKPYDHKKIEKKWQKAWVGKKMYRASDTGKAPKFYPLVEFPFPSGAGLHNGHLRSYTAMDIVSRKRRAEGFNVLFPIGWDAFGLPTENYAIKTGIQPVAATKKNTDNFRRQLVSMGFSFDWSREVNTTDPKYFKWTQWMFLQMFKKGLAYKDKQTINWCPKDKIGLANEEVVNGCCERCGTKVEKREKEQWMLAITKYADRLDRDLDKVDYLERIKSQQRNWIGRSEGAQIDFNLVFKKNPADNSRRDPQGNPARIPVFTTRPDTIFGVTYIVLAPDHAWVRLATDADHDVIDNKEEVKAYAKAAAAKTEIERTTEGKAKTGVLIKGCVAVNPATGEEIPMYVADYVLADYGTGAVMAVPAHDGRDRAFAAAYGLPTKDAPFADEATIAKIGKKIVKYKLRDWVFSRQRYWGEPIPMIHCDSCGWVPVPEKDLPVTLPKVKKYEPTDNGESPLASIEKWVKVKCPSCKGLARRETDTMPNWAGSSWYYLRYADPKNAKAFADPKKLKKWTPVDWYNGGMEHTTLHLLYSRFWHKFLFDIGTVPTDEPYMKRTSQGMILASDGEKMSKSRGNVVNPDELVAAYGADTLRLYEMFIGPFDQATSWNTDSMIGLRRFIERVWKLKEKVSGAKKYQDSPSAETALNQAIAKVSKDIEAMAFNTAVSSMMVCANALEKEPSVSRAAFESFLKLLAPFAPHVADEIWADLGNKKSVHLAPWPASDPEKAKESVLRLPVQINGRVRATVEIRPGISEKEAIEAAKASPEAAKWLEGEEIARVVFVQDKIINFLTKNK